MQERYLKELRVRYVNTRRKIVFDGAVSDPKQVYELFGHMRQFDKEKLISVHLNSRLQINCFEVVSVGATDCLLFSPKEVFKSALLSNSSGFILIHNHPTGNHTPSDADLEIMNHVKKYAPHVGLTFVDFVIVGDRGFWSLKDNCRERYQ